MKKLEYLNMPVMVLCKAIIAIVVIAFFYVLINRG
jgi:hypothetical protein